MKKQSKLGVLMKMLGMVKPLAGHMCLAVLCGTLAYLAVQAIPILGGYAVLTALGKETGLGLGTICVLLPVCAVVRAVLRYTEQRTGHYIAFTLLAIVRDKVFRALRRLCPAKLEGRDKGDLISLITADVELLEVFYAHTISPICIAILTEMVMVAYIWHFHWMMGMLALYAFVTVGVIVPAIADKLSGRTGTALREAAGGLSAYVLESIRGLDETIGLGIGQQRLDGMTARTEALTVQQEKMSRITGLNMALANACILVFDVAMLFAAALLYNSGQIGFDGFLLGLLALLSSYGPVSALAGLGTTLQSTVASGARILAVLEETPETEDITGKAPVTFAGAACEDVTFSYGGETILDGLDAQFPENRIVGVVGPSGCGKSTMLRLLMRFWDTKGGRVTVSGTDVRDISTTDLRDMESYMTQETQLFQDTIANNIRIAKLDATDEEVIAACQKASLHEFIMTLPQGYETPVGELGETLSGGERQRIGLARAFLHDAPLMLLDEPTSNLDSLNEAVILRSLREATEGRTVVLVTHRRSTARIADEILTMQDGRMG